MLKVSVWVLINETLAYQVKAPLRQAGGQAGRK